MAVAETLRFEARPQLLVDAQNRLWVAYEEGDVSWGKDFAQFGQPVAHLNRGAPFVSDSHDSGERFGRMGGCNNLSAMCG
jgi:hypothetical protein